MNGIIQYVVLYLQIIFHCVSHFAYSLINGHVFCVQFLVITNNTGMNVYIQLLLLLLLFVFCLFEGSTCGIWRFLS